MGEGLKAYGLKGLYCVKAIKLTRSEIVMVNIYCQLDKHRHGNDPIDFTVRDFIFGVVWNNFFCIL